MMLTEVLPEALPDAQAVKGFFDSLTWQKVIPPLVLLLVGLVAVRLLLRLFDRALERSRLERAAYAMLRSVMKVLLYFILLLLVAAQLGVDVEWIEFSRYRSLPIDTGENEMFGMDLPQQWKDTWTVGIGADWAFADPWTFRVGYLYMESPIPSRTMAPTLPDADRHLVSAGLSYSRKDTSLDLAYAYSFFDTRRVSDNVNPAFNGKYELSAQLVQISLRHQF